MTNALPRTRSRSRRSSVQQLMLLSDGAAPVAPAPERVLVVGVEETFTDLLHVPGAVVRFGDELGVRYLPEWELTAAALAPSFWIAPTCPTAADRKVLFETISGEVFEQDQQHRLWLDDEPLRPGSLLAFGAPNRANDGALVLGQQAALLIGNRCAHGWELRVRTTTPVLWVHHLPEIQAGAPRLPDWLRLAGTADAHRLGAGLPR